MFNLVALGLDRKTLSLSRSESSIPGNVCVWRRFALRKKEHGVKSKRRLLKDWKYSSRSRYMTSYLRTITNTRSFYNQLKNQLLDAHRISIGCWNQVESTNIANNSLKRLKTEVLDSLEAKGMFFDPLEEEVKPSPNLTLR